MLACTTTGSRTKTSAVADRAALRPRHGHHPHRAVEGGQVEFDLGLAVASTRTMPE